jgi:hypothetical protein
VGLAATFYNGADFSAPVFSEFGRKSLSISATAPTGLPSELRADEVCVGVLEFERACCWSV